MACGLSEAFNVEEILHQAEQLEQEYDWVGATELREKALSMLAQDGFSKIGELSECLGYAFHRAAMQAESPGEFQIRSTKAVQNYQKAKEFYAKAVDSAATPRILRCDAMITFLGYWLAQKAQEKNRLVTESWRLTKMSLEAFKEVRDTWNYGKTYNQLFLSAGLASFLQWDAKAGEKILKEAVEYGEEAVASLSSLEASQELTKAHVRVATYLDRFGYYFADSDERNRYYQRAQRHWLSATKLSEETAEIELLNSAPLAVMESLGWGEGTDETLGRFQKALESGRKTKDNIIMGCALDWLAYNTFWKANATEDTDKRIKLNEEALHYAIEAKLAYGRILFVTPRAGLFWVEAPYAEYYWKLASYETDPKKRHDMLEKARKAAPAQLKSAKDSGYPFIIGIAHHVFSRVLVSLARTETSSEGRKRLLEKALEHRNEDIRIIRQCGAFDYWNRGAAQSLLADIKSELASLTEDQKARKNLLQEAVSDKESSLKLLVKDVALSESEGLTLFSALGKYQYSYGDLLCRLHESAPDKNNPRKAAEAFKQAGESFKRAGIVNRVAECLWRVAQIYDALGEHEEAAKRFDAAADNYRSAKEKIPQLSTLYEDQACYMMAWGDIQMAKYHHLRQEHELAKDYFEKASCMHKELKQWSYLAPNYAAWAELERAEQLSRAEQDEEARKSFEQAARLFDETRKSIESQFGKIENIDEERMATNMLKATDTRHEYCDARIAVEEAKMLDKKGDHYSSSRKYGSAAETFERISQSQESEQEKREIQFITILSRAWEKMTMAEAEASPALYAEASELFEQAREYVSSEKTKMLVLGHSRFCKALEAGTEFADTRDQALHTVAVQHLASASNYYMKAGFQTASEYAKATKLLFDAYVYMDNAEEESDPDKKAKLYVMIGRVLQTSAGSYTKAEHPDKREQILKLLEKAKEEQELAVTMNEALHVPSIVSATTTFASPTPTKEEAIGSERFEHADVHANILVNRNELKVGENLELEIELANAGKGTALLDRIESAIPNGFEITEKLQTHRVEGSNINMKGKRLEQLKGEEVKLSLRSKHKGSFTLRPVVLYLDENGNPKSHQPEPMTITVKEMGIKGWIRGE
jgi:hypothetical protein